MKNIILFTFLFFLPLSSFAAEKLSRDVALTREEFFSRTKQIEEKPLDNPALAFRIKLPKNWMKLNSGDDVKKGELSQEILGELSHYLGPPNLDLRSEFKIRANKMNYDVTAGDWFQNYIITNNYSLQGIDVSSDRRVQAHYVTVENGRQYVVRAVAQISGQTMVLAEYIVPIELWADERDVAIWSMASFYLTLPDPVPVETLVTHSFVDIARFEYPASWILNAPVVTTTDRMSAYLINLKGGIPPKDIRRNTENLLLMDGRIEVLTVSKANGATLSGEIANLKKQLMDRGLVIGGLIGPIEDIKRHPSLSFGKTEAYKINNKQGQLADYEQWIGIFESTGRIYLVQMLTVGRQDNFLAWARNSKAFKTIVSSISPVI